MNTPLWWFFCFLLDGQGDHLCSFLVVRVRHKSPIPTTSGFLFGFLLVSLDGALVDLSGEVEYVSDDRGLAGVFGKVEHRGGVND